MSASNISEVSELHERHSNRKIKQLINCLFLYLVHALEKNPPVLKEASFFW